MANIQWGNPKITVEEIPDPQMSSVLWQNPKITVKQVSDPRMSGSSWEKYPKKNIQKRPKKQVSEKKTGVIISVSGNEKILIESDGKEYRMTSKKSCHYDSFPNHNPQEGDRIRFVPVIDNNNFCAENISYMAGYNLKLADYIRLYKNQNTDVHNNKEIRNFVYSLMSNYNISEEDVLYDLKRKGISLQEEYIGVITILNKEIKKGLIVSKGKEYLITDYKDSSDHKFMVGDKVSFQRVNPNIAQHVVYLSGYYEKLRELYREHVNDSDNEWLKVFLKVYYKDITLEEALKDVEDLKKSLRLMRGGIIKSFDLGKKMGIIRCGGKEYQMILGKNYYFEGFPNREIKIGDRVNCISTIEKNCFHAEKVIWMGNYYDILTGYYKYGIKEVCDSSEVQNFIHENKLVEQYELTEEIILQDLKEIQQREETEVQQMIMQLKQTGAISEKWKSEVK